MDNTNYACSRSGSMSDDIRQLAQAFILAKKEFVATGLSGRNNGQHYDYAKLQDIYSAVEDGLLKNNIIIWHFADIVDKTTEVLYTRLIHNITGQWVQDVRFLVSEKPGNQGKGIANTYMRKVAVLSLCAIPTEDDDGEAEQKHINRNEPAITDNQLKELQAAIKTCINPTKIHSAIKGYNNIQDLSELKISAFERILAYITNNKDKA